jgi:hypothetical protein
MSLPTETSVCAHPLTQQSFSTKIISFALSKVTLDSTPSLSNKVRSSKGRGAECAQGVEQTIGATLKPAKKKKTI